METMLVKREGHPDGVVLINAADFDPATETPVEPASETPAEPEAPAEPAAETPVEPEAPAKPKGKRADR